LLARTRDEPERYRRAYLRMLEIIMALTYPGVVFAVCANRELILVALGPRWSDVAPIFAVLGLGALLAPISYSTGWLFITQDRTRQMRNWGFASSVGYVLSFIIGLPWSPLGVAASYIAVGALQAPILWRLATRSGPVSLRDLIMTVAPCLAAAGVAAATTLALQPLLPPGVVALGVMMVAAYVAFALALACTTSGRAILRETLGESRRLARSLRTA